MRQTHGRSGHLHTPVIFIKSLGFLERISARNYGRRRYALFQNNVFQKARLGDEIAVAVDHVNLKGSFPPPVETYRAQIPAELAGEEFIELGQANEIRQHADEFSCVLISNRNRYSEPWFRAVSHLLHDYALGTRPRPMLRMGTPRVGTPKRRGSRLFKELHVGKIRANGVLVGRGHDSPKAVHDMYRTKSIVERKFIP